MHNILNIKLSKIQKKNYIKLIIKMTTRIE